MGMNPLKSVKGRNPHGVVNLIEFSMKMQKSEDAKSFQEHMKDMHDQVRRQMEKINVTFKLRVN